MTYDGHNGTLAVEGEVLTITRSGMVARASFGKNAEPRQVPLQAISGVRFKAASRLVNGWLQVLVGGEVAPELTVTTAASDGNTVMFTHKHREAFEQLNTWLQGVVERNIADGVDTSASAVTGGGSVGRFEALAAKAAAMSDKVQGSIAAQQAKLESVSSSAEHAASERPTASALFVGVSHDSGRNATVTLYADRLERVKDAKLTSLSRARQDVETTPVRSVTSVQAKKDGIMYTKVTVFASGNNIDFRFGHDEASRFKDAIMNLVLQPPVVPQPITAVSPPDLMDQLRRLGELRDAGILSDEEFTTKKTELLNRI